MANIIPAVETDRSWVTVNVRRACDGAIVFVHNNLHPENYEWLRSYKDLILVCGIPETCEKVAHLGTPIYVPLSIDVEYVSQFRCCEQTKNAAFAGRKTKAALGELPSGIDYLHGMQRDRLLKRMAEYRRIYAVGRCAIEARCLGCEVLPYDPRFPDPSVWQVVDNREAAYMLQKELRRIDHV